MSTIVDFPPRSAPAERTAVVEMEGPLNRLDDLLGALLERVENNDNPCIYSLTDDKGTEGAIMCLSQRVAPPPPLPERDGARPTQERRRDANIVASLE
jgi:hypothetical protein